MHWPGDDVQYRTPALQLICDRCAPLLSSVLTCTCAPLLMIADFIIIYRMFLSFALQVYNLNRDSQSEASKIYRNKSPNSVSECSFFQTHTLTSYKAYQSCSIGSSDLSCLTAAAQLDVIGFNIIKKFIYAIETRGTPS